MYRGDDKEINKHYIYLDDEFYPILIPCLFAKYTQTKNYRVAVRSTIDPFSKKVIHQFEEKEIGYDASYKICNHLGRFLQWVNEYEEIDLVKLSTHTALPDALINEYLNEYLIDECAKSEFVVNQAINALNSYYDWLVFFFDNKRKFIGIKSDYREAARNNNRAELAIKYLLPQTRELFYRSSNTLLEEIVLRNGGELGCRSKENQGFLLKEQKINKGTFQGMYSLFKELEEYPYKNEFEYRISSLYTKYGKPRILHINRPHLMKMKTYFETERPHSDSNHLLVSASKNDSFGRCISKRYGSDTFANVRNQLLSEIQKFPYLYTQQQEIKESNTYHHLRHSFGTDFFYNLCEGQNKNYESITTTSSVYLMTAVRLGHKVDSKNSNTVTATYIHSCAHRERLLVSTVNKE